MAQGIAVSYTHLDVYKRQGITLSTIVNSDIIPPESRGIYQAFQNVLLGIGAVIGASTGGAVASYLGWRWCFLLQVPVSVGGTIMALSLIHI